MGLSYQVERAVGAVRKKLLTKRFLKLVASLLVVRWGNFMDDLAFLTRLNALLARYDRKQEELAARNRRYHHSSYALGLYLARADEVLEEISRGSSIPRALYDNFNGQLLTFLEKSFKLPVTYHGDLEMDTGRPD